VVTGADVANVATQRAGLDAEFGTTVFKSLTELATYRGLCRSAGPGHRRAQ